MLNIIRYFSNKSSFIQFIQKILPILISNSSISFAQIEQIVDINEILILDELINNLKELKFLNYTKYNGKITDINFEELLNIFSLTNLHFNEFKTVYENLEYKMEQKFDNPLITSLNIPEMGNISNTIPTLLFLSTLFTKSEKILFIVMPFIDNFFLEYFEENLIETLNHSVNVKFLMRNDKQLQKIKNYFSNNAIIKKYYLESLLEFRIYGLENGFLHAKIILQDDVTGYLGSANLLNNSLLHNFELGIKLNKNQSIKIRKLLDIIWHKYSNRSNNIW